MTHWASGRQRRAIGLAALTLAAFSRPAAAQQAEQITVTPPAQAAPPASTTILGAGDIARSGVSTIGALLDEVPAFGSQGVNGAQNDGGFGEYFIDLRNLNFDRTLVLVDGQRFVLSGIQTDEAVDLNNIPAAFVDHIEVLADGTQPRYAADAVAGVVNIVLKDQIEGLHLDSYGGAAGAGDTGTSEISLVDGHGFEKGHFAVGLDAYWRSALLQSNRGWAANPIDSAIATPSGPAITTGSPAAIGGQVVGAGVDDLALGGGRFRPFNAATDAYDPAATRYLQGGLQRETAYFDGDYAITDAVSANAELLFTDRAATTELPPQFLGLTGTAKHPDGFVIPATDAYNPFGEPVTLERVVAEAGAQQTTTSGPVWRVLSGLDGVLGNWTWTASFDHGQSLSEYVTDNDINLTRALQTAGAAPCPAAQGCVEADWFGPNSLSQQALDYIRYTGRSQSMYEETVGQLRFRGPIFALPAGQARLTLGGEIRAEHGATTVDAVTAQGNQAGNDAAPTSGGYNTYEMYGVASLPLLRNLPAVKTLDVNLSARGTATSRYGAFGTFRGALNYAPVDGLQFQAISGKARRPPAISEAFGGITASPTPVADPCAAASGLRGNPVVNANCLARGLGPGFVQSSSLIDVLSGGNSSLRPESSENETLGVTVVPPRWPWLSGSVDWYHYRIINAIDSLEDTDPNSIPDTCYESVRLSSPVCALITRFPGGGDAGQISTILGRDENVGTIKTEGLDFSLSAKRSLARYGAVKLGWQTNWLLDYRLHTQGAPGFTQYAGSFPGLAGVGLYARVRSRATAEWSYGDWTAGWTGRFISGGRVLGESAPDLDDKAPGVFYQDVSVSRRLGKLVLMAGVDNVADVRPPLLLDGETNTATATYDVVGRFVWGKVSYDF